MHAGARQFVASQVVGQKFESVVEIGGRDINGGVRDLIDADMYTSIDLFDGPGVDVVADATTCAMASQVDLVVCCEVLEHAADPELIVKTAMSWLKPGGKLILTCATDPRAPHSTHDGAGVRDGEHYGNIDKDALWWWIRNAGGTGPEGAPSVVDYNPGDLYAVATAS